MAVGKRKALGTAGQRGFLILPGGMRSVGGIAVELERRKALTGGEHAHVKKPTCTILKSNPDRRSENPATSAF